VVDVFPEAEKPEARSPEPELQCFEDFARNSLSPIDYFAIFR
jgi:hypothetical protein